MKRSSEKKSRTITRQTPAIEAARLLIGRAMARVATLVPKAAKGKPGSRQSSSRVHELRVATRRAGSALAVFRSMLDADAYERAARMLRKIRRVCGEVRDCDVRIEVFSELARSESSERIREFEQKIVSTLRRRSKRAWPGVVELGERWPERKVLRRTEKLISSIDAGRAPGGETAFGAVVERAVADAVDVAQKAAGEDLSNIERAHELRIALKRLRYTLEAVQACVPAGRRAALVAQLTELQQSLGGVNDAHMVVEEIASHIKEQPEKKAEKQPRSKARARRTAEQDPARTLLALARKRLAAEHRTFLRSWKTLHSETLFEDVLNVTSQRLELSSVKTSPEEHSSPRVLKPAGFVEAKAPTLNGTGRGHAESSRARRRIAAIDVGTNSVRLIVAEGQPDGSYRVLDDEKEITRLGKGLHETGRMDEASIEHTAVTIARMRSIAEGYGAKDIRVVATAAAREAKNGHVLLDLVKGRTGLDMQIVSGEVEAMLAYRSAANAFDLSEVPAAVFDVGGGSTEIILSAGANAGDKRLGGTGGVIERVHSLPIGAVRLTEMFGGPEASSGDRFEEMRAHVRELIRQEVGKVPTAPQMLIGTGGTLTTLGAILKLKELGASANGLFGGVQGQEVGRADLKHLIANLRKMPIKERTKIPGLSADRADIIVAGLVIVDAVLKKFQANRVRIHEGGIRDGILLGMLRRDEEASDAARDPMKGVRRFAKACNYEAAHSKHVTMLALQIFDQLATQAELLKPETSLRFDAETRMLLEAAALLHDIGYLINYTQHHKHSYHLIVHADLPGLSVRQVQVIANVARYHRAGEPKRSHEAFVMLDDADQSLVRQLAGILRVADGLDRTHTQSVRAAEVRIRKKNAHVSVRAGVEPSVDLWGAMRKGGLFQKTLGVALHLDWVADDLGSPKPINSGEMSAA